MNKCNLTEKPRSGFVDRLVRLFQRAPKPTGPCKYCGVATSERNAVYDFYRHETCGETWLKWKAQDDARAAQKEIIKEALREYEVEKNSSSTTRMSGHQPPEEKP